jgi:hypothetical protein
MFCLLTFTLPVENGFQRPNVFYSVLFLSTCFCFIQILLLFIWFFSTASFFLFILLFNLAPVSGLSHLPFTPSLRKVVWKAPVYLVCFSWLLCTFSWITLGRFSPIHSSLGKWPSSILHTVLSQAGSLLALLPVLSLILYPYHFSTLGVPFSLKMGTAGSSKVLAMIY